MIDLCTTQQAFSDWGVKSFLPVTEEPRNKASANKAIPSVTTKILSPQMFFLIIPYQYYDISRNKT